MDKAKTLVLTCDNVSLIRVLIENHTSKDVAELFKAVSQAGASAYVVNLFPDDDGAVCFAVSDEHLGKVMGLMGKHSDFPYTVSYGNTMITVKHQNVSETAAAISKVVKVLKEVNVKEEYISASVNEVCLMVKGSRADEVLQKLKKLTIENESDVVK